MTRLIENVKGARAAGVPLLAVTTADQPATVETLAAGLNGCPKVAHDVINGLRALNDEGKQALAALGGDALRDSGRLVLALRAALALPPKTMLFVFNGHASLGEPAVVQAVQNLREPWKGDKRTLVLLGPSFADMKTELQSDVVVLDEAPPSEAELEKLVRELHEAAGKPLDESKLGAYVDAIRGLPALFTAEQVVAMSFRKDGLDLDALWERKEAAINAVKGLKITRKGPKYADLAGLDTIQRFIGSVAKGPRPFRLVLHLDEIEKMLAGSAGDVQDASGVSADYLGVLLKAMEVNRWKGAVLVGVPGSGKTALTEATAAEFGVPRIECDLGAMKGRFVGDSETAIRTAFGVIEALGGKDVLVLATCNRIKSLPPELRRRFTYGIWYFDVPTPTEQKPIKAIHEKANGITRSVHGEWPDTAGWTGAEIRNCAELAVALRAPLKEVAEYIVPVVVSDPEAIESLRALADGRFLSVSYPGRWMANRPETVAVKAKRKFD